jgi:hypothetical protein
MRPRLRPEEIIGEWGVRDVTPPSQRERERLVADADLNPLLGRPLRRRLRNFTPDPTTYLASLGGPLPYMQRARRIDEEIERHLERLAEAYAGLGHDPVAWRRVAERWDFSETNELIDKHNRYFPIEARLPMDPKTRDYVKVGGRSYRRRPLDAAWILDRFPAVPRVERAV